MRLGEIYLNRAEAKLRLEDTAGALEDINTLRSARNARPDQIPPTLSSMDLNILLRERGFEESTRFGLVSTEIHGPKKQTVT